MIFDQSHCRRGTGGWGWILDFVDGRRNSPQVIASTRVCNPGEREDGEKEGEKGEEEGGKVEEGRLRREGRWRTRRRRRGGGIQLYYRTVKPL